MRINPYELHVITPDFFETLYSGGSTRRDKWAWSANMFGNPLSVFATVPHDHHRIRRVVLNPYFSKRSVVRLEPLIQNAVENLCRRMEEFKEAGEVFPISDAYTALTMDVITEYCFAKSYNNLLKEDFGPEWPSILEDTSQGTHLVKQCGWLLKLMRAMPTPVIARLVPNMMQIINFQTVRPTLFGLFICVQCFVLKGLDCCRLTNLRRLSYCSYLKTSYQSLQAYLEISVPVNCFFI